MEAEASRAADAAEAAADTAEARRVDDIHAKLLAGSPPTPAQVDYCLPILSEVISRQGTRAADAAIALLFAYAATYPNDRAAAKLLHSLCEKWVSSYGESTRRLLNKLKEEVAKITPRPAHKDVAESWADLLRDTSADLEREASWIQSLVSLSNCPVQLSRPFADVFQRASGEHETLRSALSAAVAHSESHYAKLERWLRNGLATVAAGAATGTVCSLLNFEPGTLVSFLLFAGTLISVVRRLWNRVGTLRNRTWMAVRSVGLCLLALVLWPRAHHLTTDQTPSTQGSEPPAAASSSAPDTQQANIPPVERAPASPPADSAQLAAAPRPDEVYGAPKKEAEPEFAPGKEPAYEDDGDSESQNSASLCNSANDCNAQGMRRYRAHQYGAAIRYFKQGAEYDSTHWKSVYNLACTYALLGRADDAVDVLERLSRISGEEANSRVHKAAVDPDFNAIRSNARFQNFLARNAE